MKIKRMRIHNIRRRERKMNEEDKREGEGKDDNPRTPKRGIYAKEKETANGRR